MCYNNPITTTPTLAKSYLNQIVTVTIDRPLGSKHPKHKFRYEANYGYIAKTIAPDGEELDAYFLGVNKPLKKAKGKCIAIIHRTDDNDDKLIVIPLEMDNLTDNEIKAATNFQEQFFTSKILRQKLPPGKPYWI